MIKEIDAVGNVKIFNPLRLKYFLATLKSFSFLKNNLNIYLNIENGRFLKRPIINYLKKLGFRNIYVSSKKEYFDITYTNMIKKCKNEYILNLEDDHFCEINDAEKFFKIINKAHENKVDIIRSTFFKLNKYLFKDCDKIEENNLFSIINYNHDLFYKYNEKKPYFIQNNCIFKKDFAIRHWSKSYKSFKPHPHEVPEFDSQFSHILLVPNIEILRPIDDDHGILDTCCLKNKDNKKWESCFNDKELKSFYIWIIIYKISHKYKRLNIKSHFIDFLKNKIKHFKLL